MKIRIILIVLLIGLFAFVKFFFRDDISKIKPRVMPINTTKTMKEKTSEEEIVEEAIEDNESTNEIEEIKIETTQEVNETPKNEETPSKPQTSQKQETPKSNSQPANNQQQETPKQEADNGTIDNGGNNKPTENEVIVKKKPWEEAGVSEYDWYHKPVYSWMRVDYPVSSCGSVSNCEAQCMKDAEELAFTENVSCIQVHTFSGSYLGEMLKRS